MGLILIIVFLIFIVLLVYLFFIGTTPHTVKQKLKYNNKQKRKTYIIKKSKAAYNLRGGLICLLN